MSILNRKQRLAEIRRELVALDERLSQQRVTLERCQQELEDVALAKSMRDTFWVTLGRKLRAESLGYTAEAAEAQQDLNFLQAVSDSVLADLRER